jgi:hypothetical protein
MRTRRKSSTKSSSGSPKRESNVLKENILCLILQGMPMCFTSGAGMGGDNRFEGAGPCTAPCK